MWSISVKNPITLQYWFSLRPANYCLLLQVSAIGRPDIAVTWIFDLQLNIAKLFGVLCSNAIDYRRGNLLLIFRVFLSSFHIAIFANKRLTIVFSIFWREGYPWWRQQNCDLAVEYLCSIVVKMLLGQCNQIFLFFPSLQQTWLSNVDKHFILRSMILR